MLVYQRVPQNEAMIPEGIAMKPSSPGDFAAFVGTVDPWHAQFNCLPGGKVSTPGGFWVNLRWVV